MSNFQIKGPPYSDVNASKNFSNYHAYDTASYNLAFQILTAIETAQLKGPISTYRVTQKTVIT